MPPLPLPLRLWKHLLKPLLCSGVMGAAVFGTHRLLCDITGNAVANVAAIAVGVAVYAAMLLLARVFTKEEMAALPMGQKIVRLLEKCRVYR